MIDLRQSHLSVKASHHAQDKKKNKQTKKTDQDVKIKTDFKLTLGDLTREPI